MSEIRLVLERVRDQMVPSTEADAFERLVGYRRRKRNRQRLGAASLALLLATAGTTFALRAFYGGGVAPADQSPNLVQQDQLLTPHVADVFRFSLEEINALGGLVVGVDSLWAIELSTSNPSSSAAVLRIDPATGDIVSRAEVEGVRDLSIGDGAVWLVEARKGGGDVVSKINQASGQVDSSMTLPEGAYGGPIAFLGGSVWVGGVIVPPSNNWDDAARVLFRIDPETNTVQRTILVELCSPLDGGCAPNNRFVVADGALWLAGRDRGTVFRIDPASNGVTQFDTSGFAGLAVGEGSIWVQARGSDADPDRWWDTPTRLIRIDARTGEQIGEPAALEGGKPDPLESGGSPFAVTPGSVWVVGTDRERLHLRVARFDLNTLRIDQSVTALSGESYFDAVYDAERDSIWVVHAYKIVRISLR